MVHALGAIIIGLVQVIAWWIVIVSVLAPAFSLNAEEVLVLFLVGLCLIWFAWLVASSELEEDA